MSDPSPAKSELDERISILRENIRELVEQSAAYSGAADEENTADRIAGYEAELARLLEQQAKPNSER
jgi:uncharacterized small protein (DUF1192 family)